jgi:phosphoribosylformylglycinamidine (FGAM) synthase-like enzyme
MKALGEAIRVGMVRSCHDLSEGGLAVATAEMALASLQGVSIDLARLPVRDTQDMEPATLNIVRLFSESPSRFIVEIAPEQLGAFEKHMRTASVAITYIGAITNSARFIVQDGEEELINLHVNELKEAWKGEQL